MDIINYLMRNNSSGYIIEHVGYHDSGDYLTRSLFSDSENPQRLHKYEAEKEFHTIPKSEVDALEIMTCNSRMQQPGPRGRVENIDFWKDRSDGKCCSFCGSLHPMDVIKAIKEKGFSAIERTDKHYKWYVNGTSKYYRHHDTEEFIKNYNQLVDDVRSLLSV